MDVLNDESYKSGAFYASKASTTIGPMVDQGMILEDLNNETFQDNANEAIHRFIPVKEPTDATEAIDGFIGDQVPELAATT